MTLLSQDDHHTAGAWATCVSTYGLQILSVVQSKEELQKCFRSLATKVSSMLKCSGNEFGFPVPLLRIRHLGYL